VVISAAQRIKRDSMQAVAQMRCARLMINHKADAKYFVSDDARDADLGCARKARVAPKAQLRVRRAHVNLRAQPDKLQETAERQPESQTERPQATAGKRGAPVDRRPNLR
jgi:hypothetical protein